MFVRSWPLFLSLSSSPKRVWALSAVLLAAAPACIKENPTPTAAAGTDRGVRAGEIVQLDGKDSSSPDAAKLTFAWRFVSQPVGSGSAFSATNVANPFFVPDVEGEYVAGLTVFNGAKPSAEARVTITATGDCLAFPTPVAINEGDTYALPTSVTPAGGAACNTALGEWRWEVAERPAGSTAGVDNSARKFVPDAPGKFKLRYAVRFGDGGFSAPKTIELNAAACRPVVTVLSSVFDFSRSTNPYIEFSGFGLGANAISLNTVSPCGRGIVSSSLSVTPVSGNLTTQPVFTAEAYWTGSFSGIGDLAAGASATDTAGMTGSAVKTSLFYPSSPFASSSFTKAWDYLNNGESARYAVVRGGTVASLEQWEFDTASRQWKMSPIAPGAAGGATYDAPLTAVVPARINPPTLIVQRTDGTAGWVIAQQNAGVWTASASTPTLATIGVSQTRTWLLSDNEGRVHFVAGNASKFGLASCAGGAGALACINFGQWGNYANLSTLPVSGVASGDQMHVTFSTTQTAAGTVWLAAIDNNATPRLIVASRSGATALNEKDLSATVPAPTSAYSHVRIATAGERVSVLLYNSAERVFRTLDCASNCVPASGATFTLSPDIIQPLSTHIVPPSGLAYRITDTGLRRIYYTTVSGTARRVETTPGIFSAPTSVGIMVCSDFGSHPRFFSDDLMETVCSNGAFNYRFY